MCGRFVISSPADSVAKWFGTRNATPNSRPSYNVAPTQDILAVRFNPETRERTLNALRWGLVPCWAKDIKIGYSLINAKAEIRLRSDHPSRSSIPLRQAVVIFSLDSARVHSG